MFACRVGWPFLWIASVKEQRVHLWLHTLVHCNICVVGWSPLKLTIVANNITMSKCFTTFVRSRVDRNGILIKLLLRKITFWLQSLRSQVDSSLYLSYTSTCIFPASCYVFPSSLRKSLTQIAGKVDDICKATG